MNSVDSKIVADLQVLVDSLIARVSVLEAAIAPKNVAVKEMTDEDARQILRDPRKHNEVAKATGLSYGQIYSCRLGFTFKNVHKELALDPNFKNAWMK